MHHVRALLCHIVATNFANSYETQNYVSTKRLHKANVHLYQEQNQDFDKGRA